jgi:polysaccharide export outer membrane protein
MRKLICLPLIALAMLISNAVVAESAPWKPDLPGSDTDYIIGVEDVLTIAVWGETSLSATVFVRPDGKITFPLVNDILVAGLTPNEVREALGERLANFIRDPNVTVIVDKINSFRVYLLGEVAIQGVLNFNRPVRVLQAISIAGGFTQFSKREIIILRQEEGGEMRISINYKRLMSGEEGENNLFLQPGDTLLVN